MQKWLLAAIACIALSPESAFAAIYNFQSTEMSALGDPSYSFELNTADAVTNGTATSFSGVAIQNNGTTTTGNTITILSPTNIAGPSFFFTDTDTPQPKPFAEGSGTSITFNTGAFSIADGFTDGEGTLDIANASVSAAPELSTWLLMFAGVFGIGLTLRRARDGLEQEVRAVA